MRDDRYFLLKVKRSPASDYFDLGKQFGPRSGPTKSGA